MESVILKTTFGREVYINPEYVTFIEGADNENVSTVHMVNGAINVEGHKNLVASILETKRTMPTKFVSYKDWEWHDE